MYNSVVMVRSTFLRFLPGYLFLRTMHDSTFKHISYQGYPNSNFVMNVKTYSVLNK